VNVQQNKFIIKGNVFITMIALIGVALTSWCIWGESLANFRNFILAIGFCTGLYTFIHQTQIITIDVKNNSVKCTFFYGLIHFRNFNLNDLSMIKVYSSKGNKDTYKFFFKPKGDLTIL
jgi:hypothetical protein